MNGNQTQTQTQTAGRTAAELAAPKQQPPVDPDFLRLMMQDERTEVRYRPFATEEDCVLSIPRVRKYVASPYPVKDGNKVTDLLYPDDVECAKFILLCRARQLNPYEGDAFMVPFWDNRFDKPVWSLITAHFAFLKRAEVNPHYNGMDSGIIVKDKDSNIVEREGDFKFPGDQLLGGWAIVHRKDQNRPKKTKVNLDVYIKPFGNWSKDPGGMIAKVAEAQGLRDSFPTLVGGMYLREELEAHAEEPPKTTEKRPQFKGPHTGPGSAAIPPAPTPTLVVQMTRAASPASPKAPETAQDAPDGVKTPEKEQTQPQQPPANATAPANASSEPGETSGTEAEPPQNTEKAPEPAPYKPATPFEPRKNETPELTEVRYLLWKCGKTEDQLLPILEEKKLRKSDQKLEHLSSKRLADIAKSWDSAFLPELTKAQQ